MLYLCLQVGVLGGLRMGVSWRLGRLFRWAGRLRPWAMIEVFVVGACVAYSRLEAIGPVSIDIGGWCLLGAAITMLLAALSLDEWSVWNALPGRAAPPSSQELIACGTCALVRDASCGGLPCPRCDAVLHRRKPASWSRTLALVLAGGVLYGPAMLLPVLRIEHLGREEPSTIISGVQQLAAAGLWLLAAIVFSASVLVPLLKLVGLGTMLALTGCRSRRWLGGRMRLYRLIEFIGRWSSIDLFMISILAALVRFGTLTSVRPESGALAFAAVVILTMLASRSFDPRIMWDAAEPAP
jgi:paraquat-inducible protein A